jgi:nuclear transcription factor Y alpha
MMPGSNGATQFQTLNNMGQMQSQTTPQKLGNNNFMQNVNANNGMAQQLANFSTELGSPNLIQQQAQQQVPQSTLSNSGPNTPNSQAEEEPLYVNAKQYNRILKRRQARNKLENEGRIPKVRMVINM